MGQRDLVINGRRIRTAREALNLTQTELANLVGKTQNTISNYESGQRALRVDELPVLAEALKVSILYFFEDGGLATAHDPLLYDLTAQIRGFSLPFRQVIRVLFERYAQLEESLYRIADDASDEAFTQVPQLIREHNQQVTQETSQALLRELFQQPFKRP